MTWNDILVFFGMRTDMSKIVGKFELALAKLESHTVQSAKDAEAALKKALALQAIQAAAVKESERAKTIAKNFRTLLAS